MRWAGRTVAIAASGPSQDGEDLDEIRGRCPIVAINNTWELAPWAEVLYSCDRKWWDVNVAARSIFAGEKWTCDESAALLYDLRLVIGRPGCGYAPTGPILHHFNSGAQAIQLAAQWGATRIVLLGFDHRNAPDGRKHWHGDHASVELNMRPNWRKHIAAMHVLAAGLREHGVEVLNASRETALDCWPRVDLEDLLPTLHLRLGV